MDNDLIFGTETDDMVTEAGVHDTQIAMVSSSATPLDDALPRPFDAAQVVVPEGAGVVRIPVAAGEFVELPFPADAQFLARIDDGNLAIRVGDVTVILQGYVEAARQTRPVIEAADGQSLDIATILAATDPAIDIETAAGPAGAHGQGADNTGAFFQQLDDTGGLGGFQGVGAQGGTDDRGGGADDPGGGTADQSGTLVQQSARPTDEPNVAPIAQGGVGLILASEDAGKNTIALDWIVIDPDDAGHTITLDPAAALPQGVTFDSKTETLLFDIAGKYDYLKHGDSLDFPLTFTITDDRGASTERDVDVKIFGANDAPVAVRDTVLIDDVSASAALPLWALAVNDRDAEGDALHVSTVEGIPKFGDETIIFFVPPGDSSLRYTVSDGMVDSGRLSFFFKHDAVIDGDITGTEVREILVGSAADETLRGNGGNDIISGNGGTDEIFGGTGDDTLVFSAGSKIHGQTDSANAPNELAGVGKYGDILAIGDATLDFSDHASVADLDGIETISMQARVGGFTAQSLTIGAHSVQDLSDHTIAPGGVFAEHEAVRIDGDAVDQLYLSISKDGGSWTDTGVDANGYHVYAHETTAGEAATADAYVMVSTTVPAANVHLDADAP